MYDKKNNTPAASVTEEMKEGWSEKYGAGKCGCIRSVDGSKACYVRPPKRTELGAYGLAVQKNPVTANEFLLKQIWLAGDPEMIEEDKYFNGACEHLSEMIEAEKATLDRF
jgi:hypothetical protein